MLTEANLLCNDVSAGNIPCDLLPDVDLDDGRLRGSLRRGDLAVRPLQSEAGVLADAGFGHNELCSGGRLGLAVSYGRPSFLI